MENSLTCKIVEQTFKPQGLDVLSISCGVWIDETQIVEHFSSSSKLITWTISNFANFKYFGNLCAITYERQEIVKAKS